MGWKLQIRQSHNGMPGSTSAGITRSETHQKTSPNDDLYRLFAVEHGNSNKTAYYNTAKNTRFQGSGPSGQSAALLYTRPWIGYYS